MREKQRKRKKGVIKELNDKKKAAEKLKRLMNTNFTEKDLRMNISYEKAGSKADTSLLMANK